MDSNFLLKCLDDGTETAAGRIDWLEWDWDNSKNRRFGNVHSKPLVGRSLILDLQPIALDLFQPGNYEKVSIAPKYAAILEEVTEVVESRKDYVKFITDKATYELFIRKNLTPKPKGFPVGE